MKDAAEGWREPLKGAVCPQGPEVWPCEGGGGWTQCQCEVCEGHLAMAGHWTSPMHFLEPGGQDLGFLQAPYTTRVMAGEASGLWCVVWDRGHVGSRML